MTIVGLLSFRWSFADQYVIPSGSMEPTIQIGDHVLVDKLAYDLRVPFTQWSLASTGEPSRGDIAVFRDPRDPKVHLIKRIIGIPGDRVLVRDGYVEVNGQSYPQEGGWEQIGELSHRVQRTTLRGRGDEQTFSVPEGHYFFLGDARDNSADSRVWGYAPRNALEGRALRVLYNFKNLRRSGERIL